ncbi:UNVERIFIED_CONTAM: hypothetical protein Sangu_3139000 [Sesamum angustifolium]|uniref:Uncharacterized protein n=1 Tax=Sesamum angustifolium TaxID=2727405 RepID=A0AAW2K0A4_9LAMI
MTSLLLSLLNYTSPKRANKKTRNRTYDILVQIGHACGDEEKGDEKEKLHQFFNMVAGGLVGETPHMVGPDVVPRPAIGY